MSKSSKAPGLEADQPATIPSHLAFSWPQRVMAWLVHLFTAGGAAVGLLTFYAIHLEQWTAAFWLMGAAILIDSVDGLLARRFEANVRAPGIDGALLDNLIDYLNYVVAPAFFLLVHDDLLPAGWRIVGGSIIVLASAYQFTQSDAKTSDHFFKGFPSYWNIVVFYLFFWQTPAWLNLVIVVFLVVMVFVPIKYVYPSRLDYLTRDKWLQTAMWAASIVWGISTAMLLWIYPNSSILWTTLSMGYVILYALLSLYRTFVPLQNASSG